MLLDETKTEGARITLVAALGRNNALGRENKLIWQLKTDLKRYKQITMGKPMIMGRKTYQSIGRPLPGRQTIVLTRDQSFDAKGVIVVRNLDDALKNAQICAKQMNVDEIIIAGGQDVYTQTLPLADCLRLTFVDDAPEGDAWFPHFSMQEFKEVYREHVSSGEDDDHSFDFVDLKRMK